ncbi:MAG: hypothetical protein JWM68_5343 [Verrucomicrobiales bacterium]|nr:hypothetical protein [Verrucomicrobiales bacterium]
MSCVCILTPVVIAAWPSFSAAVVAAATSLGYVAVAEQKQHQSQTAAALNRINLEIENSEIVTTQIGRDQKISVMREGVKVTFARDARGRASLCVEGEGHSDAALRAMGEELSQRVVQKYVYQRLMDEMRAKQFHVVEEQTNEDNSIRIKVRRWDN